MDKEEGIKHLEQVPTNVKVNDAGFANAARDATDAEHRMTVAQAIKLYPKAVGWSLLLSTAIIMEGYDTLLLGSFYGMPQFQKKYGTVVAADGTRSLSAAWRSGLSDGANVGEIIGLQFTGVFQDRFGYRKTMIGALSMVTCFIFILFFAPNIHALLAGEILCGVAWGVFQTITTAYASEVCPVALRAYLTTYVNLCWVLGQFIGSGVIRGALNITTQWAYRIPFAIQWIWPVPLIIGCFLAPESPWWCVRKGKIDDAKKNLLRLTSRIESDFDVDNQIAMMQYTNEMEREETAGTSYWDCFKGVNLRRTEIVCIVWLIQNICGSTFMGFSTSFYEDAGMSATNSFNMNMIQYALGAVGTMSSWFLMGYVGRRKIYLFGLVALCALMSIIGFTSLAHPTSGRDWAIGSMLVIFTFTYDLTVGPVCYSLVAELSSTRLRAKSIVLARNVYNVGGIVVTILSQYQLTSTAWNWGAHTGFFWAGSCVLCIIWTFFRLPEPKGRTYAELDILFEQRVSARKFASTPVDIFRGVDISSAIPERQAKTEETAEVKAH